MALEPGWLQRQIKTTHEDTQTWPEWMRREGGLGPRDLELALERARAHIATPEERKQFAISFAYGNLKVSGWKGERADIERAAEGMEW